MPTLAMAIPKECTSMTVGRCACTRVHARARLLSPWRQNSNQGRLDRSWTVEEGLRVPPLTPSPLSLPLSFPHHTPRRPTPTSPPTPPHSLPPLHTPTPIPHSPIQGPLTRHQAPCPRRKYLHSYHSSSVFFWLKTVSVPLRPTG